MNPAVNLQDRRASATESSRRGAFAFMRCFVVAMILAFSGGFSAGPFEPSTARAADVKDADKGKADEPAPSKAIPLGNVASEADAAMVELRAMTDNETAQKALGATEQELPGLVRDVNVRARENRGILAQRPPLDLVRQLDVRWQEMQARVSVLSARVGEAIESLNRNIERTEAIEQTWSATAALARDEKAPPELLRRIESLLSEVAAARRTIEARRTQALKLQTQISDVDVRMRDVLQENRKAREAALARMFTRDSTPLWQLGRREPGGVDSTTEWTDALEAQGSILHDYVEAHGGRFALHAALLAGLIALFHHARRRLTDLVEKEPGLAQPATLLRYPIAAALVLALMFTHWLYPQPPRVLLAINGIAIFVPTILVLRRLVSQQLILPLYVVLVLYFVDQARSVSASIDIVPRLLFVGEMTVAAVFLLWFIYGPRRATDRSPGGRVRSVWKLAGLLGFALCAAAAAANAAGYVSLSYLIGDTVLDSMYAGLILYTAVQILDTLVEIATRTLPLTALRMVRNHRVLLQLRIRRGLHVAAIAAWALYELNLLAIGDSLIEWVRAILAASMHVGQIEISLASFLSFIAVIWAAFLVSRLIQFVLDEEVFPHASLSRGIPYAISRTLHFAIIAVGFVIAMSALGMEMTKLTILASAFTIGVGFGLQNIFNNFVSGLIVLFERPVQVGDVIQIDDAVGAVERIGIRASVMRTANGSEVIVPNGKLISDRVVNWTLSGRQRVIEVPISVALQSDPEKVVEIIERAARAHPAVLQDPPVQVMVTRLGPDWMGFELRAAIADAELWMKVRSELAVLAVRALRDATIALR